MIYAATGTGVLAHGEGTTRRRLGEYDPECLIAHPERPHRAFVGTYANGLFRTTDWGESFERVGEGGIDPEEGPETAKRRGVGEGGVSVTSVALDPQDPAEVWAGTEPSALFHSADGGDSWERVGGIRELPSEPEWAFPPRPYTHHVRWVEVDPHNPDRLHVAIEAGALLRTEDGGETWSERAPGSRRDVHTVTTHPDAPGYVWTAAGDGYAESDDAGDSWHHPQAGLDHRYCWSVAVDPGDQDTVFVSAAAGAGRAHGGHGGTTRESYLYRKRGGEPWERLAGLPTGEGVSRAVLEAGERRGEVYALHNRGLYRSGDAGDTWDAAEVGWSDAVASSNAVGLVVV
jgi:photosystem II stability/assembly factor-like uncharacterized protein